MPLIERDEVIRVAGGSRRSGSRCARPGTARCSPTSSGELSSVGRQRAGAGGRAAERGNGYAVALAWTALTPEPHGGRDLRARHGADWTEFRAAAADFAVPSQNLVYADRAGNIGYQAPGRIPIRKGGNDGDYPVAGLAAAGRLDRARTCRSTRCPACSTPPRGSSSPPTRPSTGPGYPYYLGDSLDHGYRSQRIRDLLTAAIRRPRLDVADMSADPARHPQPDRPDRWCPT